MSDKPRRVLFVDSELWEDDIEGNMIRYTNDHEEPLGDDYELVRGDRVIIESGPDPVAVMTEAYEFLQDGDRDACRHVIENYLATIKEKS